MTDCPAFILQVKCSKLKDFKCAMANFSGPERQLMEVVINEHQRYKIASHCL